MTTSVTVETSGLHPATAGCLEAMQWLQGRHECHNILDIGCGNGILSLTAGALWDAPVLATDISPQAIEDARQQCEDHEMTEKVTVLRSDGFQHPLIKERAPYDLIICNLLAEPLMQWAPQLHSHLSEGGIGLLSGILVWLAPRLEAAYQQAGFEKLHTVQHAPWMTCLFRRT